MGPEQIQTLKDAVGQSWGVASLGGAQRFNAQMTVEGMGFKRRRFSLSRSRAPTRRGLEALDTGRDQLASLSHLGAMHRRSQGLHQDKSTSSIPHTAKYTPPVPRLVVVAQ